MMNFFILPFPSLSFPPLSLLEETVALLFFLPPVFPPSLTFPRALARPALSPSLPSFPLFIVEKRIVFRPSLFLFFLPRFPLLLRDRRERRSTFSLSLPFPSPSLPLIFFKGKRFKIVNDVPPLFPLPPSPSFPLLHLWGKREGEEGIDSSPPLLSYPP